ncbi:hypothetical protein [Ramlibacter humi]|uniref:Lipoprotein n=1 Tax=Ramlibacter humi TaxID=2530451 RepID=A0A4Z0BY25_9BURK|nr:hypothetical protein [Ramlibacter humi]TFZ03861.1 hypothetical protein EZ216_09435 [Ramlibacter humi]
MRSWPTRIAVLAAAAAIAGCGGGGGSGGGRPVGFSSGTSQDADTLAVLLVVELFDSLAGLQRMLLLEPATAQLVAGPAGLPSQHACPAGGTITLQKISNNTANFTAANCQLNAADGLIYSGTWVLTQTASTYQANGSCPVAFACAWQGTVDVSGARFGYGAAATRQAIGRNIAVTTDAIGTVSVQVTASAESLVTDGGTGLVSGTPAQASLDLGAIRYTVGGVPATARTALGVTSPFSATITLDQNVTAAIDHSFDGTVDKTLTLPWSAFQN